jgi:hypothetical protein
MWLVEREVGGLVSSFTEALIAKKLTARTWEVMKAFQYHVGSEDSNEVVEVPKGFVTDFASVPRFAWWLIPPDGNYTQAAVVHDYLYHTKPYTRHRCDQIFLEAMAVLGVPRWKRSIMFMAVRIACWYPWKWRKPLLPIMGLLLIASLLSQGCIFAGQRFFLGAGSREETYYESGALKSFKVESRGILEKVVSISGIGLE